MDEVVGNLVFTNFKKSRAKNGGNELTSICE
jgi:hypothetical protein